MKVITINTQCKYPIYIGKNILSDFINHCVSLNKRLAILVDENILFLGNKILILLRENNLSAELFTVPAGEKNKTRDTKHYVEDQLLEKKFNRDSCFIAVVGGVPVSLV